MIRFGNYHVASVVSGYDRLDGGAMFGVVPKALWAKTEDVDEANRIRMALRVLLAVDPEGKRAILVDAGAGSKWTREEAARYAIEDIPGSIPAALAAFGLAKGDVTDVVLTHLHFDHCGGATEWSGDPGGGTRLRFPNAAHWVHERQWRQARNPTVRDRASYRAHDFAELAETGKLRILEGEPPAPTIPGVRWFVSNGHTPGQLLPIFEDPEHPLLFAGDAIPSASHLGLPWVMAYDLYPMTTIEEKERVFAMCRDEGLRLAFCHDRSAGAVSIAWRDGKPEVGEILDLGLPRA